MASEEKKYTPDFKIKVAEEALDQGKQNLDTLSDKFDVPVSLILMWTAEYEKHGADAFDETDVSGPEKTERTEEPETVTIDITDEKIAESVSLGAMFEDLNMRTIVFWSIVGFVLFNVFVTVLHEMYHRDEQLARDQVSATTEFYQVNQLINQQKKELSEFGVVDAENGIYRIPIDSVINEMAVDSE